MMTDLWNARTYSQFLDLRTRPAKDLLSAIPQSFQPQTIYDLGCGPGNSTSLLKDRWPDAHIIGLDSSSDMLKAAKAAYPNLHFTEGNIANFTLHEKIDCFFANASLQWLDKHEILFPKLLQQLNSGGILAIQMPNNFHSPSHQTTLKVLQNNIIWEPLLKNLRYSTLTEPLYQLKTYYDLLIHAGAHSLQIWETEYFQEMSSYQDIFAWGKGTGLQPVLTAMNAENQAQFEQAYIEAITQNYPPQMNQKILLPFRRIFMVGCR